MKNSLLTVQDVSFSYLKKQVLSHVDFEVEEGTYVSLIGPNGSGKTTFIHLLSGYLKCRQGAIDYNGHNIETMSPKERAKEIAVVYQNTTCNFPYTCFETVMMGSYPHRSRFEGITKVQMQDVEEAMQTAGVLHLAEREITGISGGELQRVLLARALVQKPRLLLLDEAMSDLDIAAKLEMNRVLRNMVLNEHLTVLAVHHDLNIAFDFSDHIVALKKGQVAADDTTKALARPEFFREVFGVEAQIYEKDKFVLYDTI